MPDQLIDNSYIEQSGEPTGSTEGLVDVYDTITAGLESIGSETDPDKFIAGEMHRLIERGVPLEKVLSDTSLVVLDRFLPGDYKTIKSSDPGYIHSQGLAAMLNFASIEARRLAITEERK